MTARALTHDGAAALARWQLGIGGEDEPAFLSDTPEDFHGGDALAAYILSVLPIVAAAERQLDAAVADAIAGHSGDSRHPEYDAWLATTDATEAAVRTRRAQMTGGG